MNLPWWLLLLGGIFIGWCLEWLLEVLYFRRNKIKVDDSLFMDAQASLQAKDEEFSLIRRDHDVQLGSLQTDLNAATKARLALDAQLKAKDLDLGKLRGNLDASLKTKDLELGDVTAKLGIAQTELAKLKVGSAAIDGDLKAALAAKASLEGALKTKDIDLSGLTAKFKGLQAEFDKLMGDHSLKLGELASLTAVGATAAATAAATLKGKGDELNGLKIRIGELESLLKAKDTELGDVNVKFNGLRGDFDKLKIGGANLDGDLKAALSAKANLEGALKAKDADLTGLNAKLNGLQVELDKLKGEHTLKLGELAALSATGATVAASLKGKDDELGGLKVRITDLLAQLKTKDAELGDVNVKFNGLRGDFDKLKIGGANLDGDLKAALSAKAKLEGALTAKDADLTGLNVRLNGLQVELDKLKGEHTLKLGELAALSATGATVAASLKGKDDELGGLKVRITDLLAQLKTKDAELGDVNVKFNGLRGDFDKLKIGGANLDGDLKAALSAKAKLEGALTAKDADLVGLNAKLNGLQVELDKLKGEHTLKLGEIVSLGAAGATAAATLKGKNDELAGLNARINDLLVQLKSKNTELDDQTSRFSLLENNHLQLGNTKAQLEARIGDLESQLNGLKNDHGLKIGELAALTAAGATAAATIKHKEDDLALAHGRIGNLESELAELRGRLTESESARQTLVASFDSSQAEAAAAAEGVEVQRSECPQHLSEIKGIGTVFEQRLYEYGVGTYWEVAHLSDDDFRKALKLDDIASASKTGARMLKIDLSEIRASAMELAKETNSRGRTWLRGNPDDFEPIDGIGHTFELRLYNAGICTYEALIQTSPERLAEICKGPKFNPPNYASWIAQAVELMAKKGE